MDRGGGGGVGYKLSVHFERIGDTIQINYKSASSAKQDYCLEVISLTFQLILQLIHKFKNQFIIES